MEPLQTMEGFEQENEESDLTETDFFKTKVFSVFRREGERSWNSVLYMRKYLLDFEKTIMSEFWNNENKTRLYVGGPPGCGKTCFFNLWARLRSVNDNKRVLIVQFREKDTCFIWIREAGGKLWRLNDAIKPSKLEDTVEKIIYKNKEAKTPFDLCIHDGVLDGKLICTNMLGTLNTAVTNGVIKKVVHVASLAFSLSTGGQLLDKSGPIVQLRVDSWRLKDYHEAIACEEFATLMTGEGTKLSTDKETLENKRDDIDTEKHSLDAVGEGEMTGADVEMVDNEGSRDGDGDTDTADDVSWTDVIETKYYYAGGSARFMFDFELSELRTLLDLRCQNVLEDDWKHFARDSVTPGTPTSVNTLMQQFKGSAYPVSKYILFRAYEKCKTDLVKAVAAAANRSNNPALKGWAFELKQIDLIRLSLESDKENPVYITNNAGLYFRPFSQIDFDENILLEKGGTHGGIQQDGTIIWCLKWNQGCFDVAFYRNSTLITLQFTVSGDHSLKPNFIRILRDALKEKGVDVANVVHVAVADVKNFTFVVSTSGTGRQGGTEGPQFVINAYHSLPLESVSPPAVFEAKESPTTDVLAKIEMWELATTKKRRRK